MSEKESSTVQAAKFSLWAPLLGLLVSIVASVTGKGNVLLAMTAIGLYVAGVVCGIVALAGIRRHGSKGVLGRAIAGITISVIMLALVVMVFASLGKARRLARERAAQEPSRSTSTMPPRPGR